MPISSYYLDNLSFVKWDGGIYLEIKVSVIRERGETAVGDKGVQGLQREIFTPGFLGSTAW